MMAKVKTAVDPDAILQDWRIFLGIHGPLPWGRSWLFERCTHIEVGWMGYYRDDTEKTLSVARLAMETRAAAFGGLTLFLRVKRQ